MSSRAPAGLDLEGRVVRRDLSDEDAAGAVLRGLNARRSRANHHA
jgi:hypothetical protein